MNQQEFDRIFEKLTLRRYEVLQQVLLGETDTAIADSMGIRETTVRKHIERICQEFGLDNDNQEGRRYRRSELVALFAKYKPELLSDRTFGSTKGATVVDTADTAKNTGIAEVVISATPLSVLQTEQIPDELNNLLFQLFLAREPAEELLNKEFEICSDEQEKIQRAKTLNKIGYHYYLEGNFQIASFYLQWAIKFNPDIGAAHYNLGLTYERLCDLSKAYHHYEIARKQNNRAADSATNNLARLKIRQQNPETAVELINPILLRVKDTEVKSSLHKNLGWAYYELKFYEQAKQHLLISLELKNDYAPAYYLLAKVQEFTDDKEGALASFKNFLNHDSNEPKLKGKDWRLPELDDWHFEAVKCLNTYNHH